MPSTAPISDSTRYLWSAIRCRWDGALEAERSKTQYQGEFLPLITDIARALVNVAVVDTFRMGLRVGVERDNFLTDPGWHSIYGGQLSWRPSERTALDFDAEKRFFGNGVHLTLHPSDALAVVGPACKPGPRYLAEFDLSTRAHRQRGGLAGFAADDSHSRSCPARISSAGHHLAPGSASLDHNGDSNSDSAPQRGGERISGRDVLGVHATRWR